MRKERLEKIFTLFSILIIVFFSGCIMGDERYAIAKEEYHMGWILHNVNESTSTEIGYSLDDIAIYNYSFNYPSDQPEDFSNVLFWIPPVHKNSSAIEITFQNRISTPLNRTYFLKGVNPVPEYYMTNWSFANYMYINYLPDYYDDLAHQEHYESISPFFAINPAPGDKRHIYFGTAPFKPTGIKTGETLELFDHLIKGYNNNSYLLRDTWYFENDKIPSYEIYLNDNLLATGKLIDISSYWNYSVLKYSLANNGVYKVKITIPSNYPVWNITRIDAKFTKPSSDIQPPVINKIDGKPYFNHNELYKINLYVDDNVGIENVYAFYWDGINWVPLPLTKTLDLYNTTINVTDIALDKIDFKVSAIDASGNQINYTIQPISLLAKNVSIDVETGSALRGGKLHIEGGIKDNNKGIGGLRLEFFLNESYVKSGMSAIKYNQGEFEVDLENISCDVSVSSKNVSVYFSGTGIYLPNHVNLSVDIDPLDFSINDTVPVHDYALIDASGAGALLTINRTDLNWKYSTVMDSKSLNFRPRNYGNYTISLNTTCGENVTKNLFSNITQPPSIYYTLYRPFYPIEKENITFYVYSYSQGNHFVTGNISNSTFKNPIVFSRYGYEYLDYLTGEPYNSSYGVWFSYVNDLNVGRYNVSIDLTDIIGQKINTTKELIVYPPLNVTFNITDHNGVPQTRTITISFGPHGTSSKYGTFSIFGVKNLTIPNVSFFDTDSHLSLDNYLTYSNGAFVNFVNTKMKKNMDVISEYIEKDTFIDDKILHSIYSFRPSWNYNSSVFSVYYYYSDLMRLNVSHPENTNLYVCSNWDFSKKECQSKWEKANITEKSFYSIGMTGTGGIIEAFAFGESQFCGDGYCSSTESCLSCPNDCGRCTTTSTILTTTTTIMTTVTSSSSTSSSTTTYITTSTTLPTTSITTTSLQCREIGNSCESDVDCCSGHCCKNICLSKECEIKKEFKMSGLYIGIITLVVSVSIIGVLYYTGYLNRIIEKIPFRKKEVLPSISFDEEIGILKSKIKSLEEKGIDVTEIKKEILLAENAMRNGLKNLAYDHLLNVRKKIKD